jgi:hypothetical protein
MNDAVSEWGGWSVVGVMPDGEGGWLELRNDPATHTTLSRQVLCGCGGRAAWQSSEDDVWRCDPCDREWGMR